MRRLILALILLPCMVAPASADFMGTGAGFAIPDNNAGGASSGINVALAPDETITDVEIVIKGFAHTWVGDLTVTLTGPGGSMDIMWRTGNPSGACCGDSSDLSGDYTFSDDGGDWWGAANATASGSPIPVGDYSATTIGDGIIPPAGPGIPQSFSGTFGGSMANGNWTLAISDHTSGDSGSIDSWELHITSSFQPPPPPVIPEPTTLLIFGAGGLLGLTYLRRRR